MRALFLHPIFLNSSSMPNGDFWTVYEDWDIAYDTSDDDADEDIDDYASDDNYL